MKYKNHPLNNVVIKNTSEEMGKEIIEFWKSQGINTSNYIGNVSKVRKNYFYGLVEGRFWSYTEFDLKGSYILSEVPEYKHCPPYPSLESLKNSLRSRYGALRKLKPNKGSVITYVV